MKSESVSEWPRNTMIPLRLCEGGGELTAAKFYYSGGQMILEGVLARLHGIPLAGGGGSSDPAHRNRLMLVRQGGKLVTTGRANVSSVTLEDGSEWDHQGEPENCCGVTLVGGSRFEAAATESRSGGPRVCRLPDTEVGLQPAHFGICRRKGVLDTKVDMKVALTLPL
jgi:hypothetical protein